MLIPKGALVVSCQARADNPLHGPVFMSAMARAAEAGGAAGIRANGADDVAAIRAVTHAPDHRHREGVGRSLPGLHHARASSRPRRSPRPAPTSSASMPRRVRATASRSTA